MRRACNHARRLAQRSARRQSPSQHQLRNDYVTQRKVLKSAIRTAQAKSWEELCRAVDNDPWGLPYRVVTRRIGRSRPGIEALGRENEVADHLFLELPVVVWSDEPTPPQIEDTTASAEFHIDDIREASARLPSGKATGPDGIPNEVLRQVAQTRP